MNPDQSSNPGELTDSDLDQVLAAANEELLAHIKAVADPTPTLVAIMIRTGPAAPADDTTTPAAWLADMRAGRRDGKADIPDLPAGSTASQPSKQEVHVGEFAEMEALYAKLMPDLTRYLRRMLPPSGLAEDVAQDAFLSLVRSWPNVRNYQDPRAWLYTVATHRAFHILRERSREFILAELLDQQAAGKDDPAGSAAAAWEAVGELPARQREAVWLHYVAGFTWREIATIMQITRGRVAALLHQARSQLIARLSLLEDWAGQREKDRKDRLCEYSCRFMKHLAIVHAIRGNGSLALITPRLRRRPPYFRPLDPATSEPEPELPRRTLLPRDDARHEAPQQPTGT